MSGNRTIEIQYFPTTEEGAEHPSQDTRTKDILQKTYEQKTYYTEFPCTKSRNTKVTIS